MSDDLNVRPATEADVPAILDIYNHFILSSTATFDVDPQTLRNDLDTLVEVLVAEQLLEIRHG